MGAWGVLALENDAASDWAFAMAESNGLEPVTAAFAAVEGSEDYLDADIASEALAACEVLVRLQGRAGYTSAYSEAIDTWVAEHSLTVPTELRVRAHAVIGRILGDDSELRELWDEAADASDWHAAVSDLRERVGQGEAN